MCDLVATRLDRSTPVGSAVLEWKGNPDYSGDSLPLRLAGGLNALVRQGRLPHLAKIYPPHPLPEPDEFWSALSKAFTDAPDEILPWFDYAPQTNEVGRSAVLFSGLSYLASIHGEPMQLFEVGASAGLNLNLDRYGYILGGKQFGDSASPLQLAPAWHGPPPPRAEVKILSRRGCDLAPPNRDRLLAYVWPDQEERIARLTRALEIASLHPVEVDCCDAASWVEQHIRHKGLRVLMHSIAFQYFPPETQRRITDHLETIGASSEEPLAWLRFELDREMEGQFSLRLRLWPNGGDRLLAIAGPHGTPIEWLAG